MMTSTGETNCKKWNFLVTKMTSIDYETDTLTSAKNNRAASQRFYNQVMTPSRTLLPHEIPVMLHRSPSGAKRKIRQRREEQGSRPSPFLSPSSSSTSTSAPSPTPTEEGNYRSLIDSGAYHSILPDFQPAYIPIPQPRLNASFSTSMSSLDVTNSSVTSISSPPPPQHSKPTVEVHPMPSEDRLVVVREAEMKKEKPAVPAKPKNLKIDHIHRSTSLNSLTSPVSQATSNFLNNLIGSPSLINLQEAYKNPDLSSQELGRLEDKRLESIGSVNKRIYDFEEEKGIIENEMTTNERLGQRLLNIIEVHDTFLANKVRRHLEHNKDLLKLESKLCYQMSKIMELLRDGTGDQSEALIEESRLRRRMNDANLLRMTYTKRERDMECAMSRIFEEEDSRRWHLYKDNLVRLVQNEKQVEDRIIDSKRHLRALQNTRPTS